MLLGPSRRCCFSHAVMQQQLLLVVLLVLGSAAVLAAAAPVLQQRRAAAARAADPGAVRITSSLAAPADAVPISPQACPGIEANGAVCGKVRGSVRQQRGCVLTMPAHSWGCDGVWVCWGCMQLLWDGGAFRCW